MLSMSVDLAGKKGPVSKTVQVITNDPGHPVTTLTVTMSVKDSLHARQFNAAAIFEGKCRDCHVELGREKKGFELFRADCFMCHNAGNSATITEMSRRTEKELLKAIREGVEKTTMPGWALNRGGPLSDAEIDSLIKTIRNPN
jgi:hypothetical protein